MTLQDAPAQLIFLQALLSLLGSVPVPCVSAVGSPSLLLSVYVLEFLQHVIFRLL